jgi:hypothetical protein
MDKIWKDIELRWLIIFEMHLKIIFNASDFWMWIFRMLQMRHCSKWGEQYGERRNEVLTKKKDVSWIYNEYLISFWDWYDNPSESFFTSTRLFANTFSSRVWLTAKRDGVAIYTSSHWSLGVLETVEATARLRHSIHPLKWLRIKSKASISPFVHLCEGEV